MIQAIIAMVFLFLGNTTFTMVMVEVSIRVGHNEKQKFIKVECPTHQFSGENYISEDEFLKAYSEKRSKKYEDIKKKKQIAGFELFYDNEKLTVLSIFYPEKNVYFKIPSKDLEEHEIFLQCRKPNKKFLLASRDKIILGTFCVLALTAIAVKKYKNQKKS